MSGKEEKKAAPEMFDGTEIYEKDGIKFTYRRFGNTEGSEKASVMRATKGVNSYYKEFIYEDLGSILKILDNDSDLFDTIIDDFFKDAPGVKGSIKVSEDIISVTIDIEICRKNYSLKFSLMKEKIDEMLLIKRRLSYLMEKVESYENTFQHCFDVKYYPAGDYAKYPKYSEGKWKSTELPMLDASRPNYQSETYLRLIDSKTDGFFAEISNHDLHQTLLKNSEFYKQDMKTYEDQGVQNPRFKMENPHPLHRLVTYYSNPQRMIDIILNIIQHNGYEFMGFVNSIYHDTTRGTNVYKLCVLLAKSNIKYKYEIRVYDQIDTRSIKDSAKECLYYSPDNPPLQVRKIKV